MAKSSSKSKKKNKVRLQSTESPYFKTIYKSAQKSNPNGPQKLEFMKFDPILRKHVKFVEKKIPS